MVCLLALGWAAVPSLGRPESGPLAQGARATEVEVPVLAAPDPAAALVDLVPAGTPLTILTGPEHDADLASWFQVSAGDDGATRGWVSAGSIAFGDPPTAALPATTLVWQTDGDGLRLRAQPSLDADILAVMPEGAAVSIVGAAVQDADGATWVPVDFEGQTGYAAGAYLATTPVDASADASADANADTSADARADATTDTNVRLAYFSKPASNVDTATVAASSRIVILPHKDESYRDALRAAGYAGQTLEYILAGEAQGPGPYADASAPCDTSFQPFGNNVAWQPGDFCANIHPHEDWFLHNSAGQRLYSTSARGVFYQMNVANPGWQQFAAQRMAEMLGSFGFDGVFLDNVELNWTKPLGRLPDSDGGIQEFASNDDFRAGWTSYLAVLSDALRPHGQLWANGVNDSNDGSDWNDYLPYLDGGMFESFATGYADGLSPGAWQRQLDQAAAMLAQGKGVIGVAQGAPDDFTAQQYALASYLLIADQQFAYFRYAASASYQELWLYDNYAVRLGAPLGARYQQADGTWRRDFSCGAVIVDPAGGTAQFNAGSCP